MFKQERQMESKMIKTFIMVSILWIAYCLYSNNVNSFVAEHGLIDKTNQVVYNIIGVVK
jgi:hypothetical protein